MLSGYEVQEDKADILSSKTRLRHLSAIKNRCESNVGHLGRGDRSRLSWLGSVRNKKWKFFLVILPSNRTNGGMTDQTRRRDFLVQITLVFEGFW